MKTYILRKPMLAIVLAVILAHVALLLAVVLATPAKADHWSLERMNAEIDQTNFIVGNGCSGTLISVEHRLILTNHHCIDQAIKIVTKKRVGDEGVVKETRVEELADVPVSQRVYADFRRVGDSTWQTQIVAKWKESDLALLQIRAATIPQTIAATLYKGDSLQRGATVFIVGNPLGLDASVTKGVVSSTNRMFRVPWAEAEVPFLQIDAGIAGGNSGGALYTDHGELIGVPAARAQDGHLGLAIPFFRITEFLDENCYAEIYDPTAKSHAECIEPVEEDADAE